MGRGHIGLTPADEPDHLVGRFVETTVGELTNDFSKHNIKLKLEIVNVTGDVANTRFVGHEITTDYLRSIVKRQTSRIDSNLDIKTKDGYQIRIKPICFTVKRARSSQIRALRDVMNSIVTKRAAETNYEQFIEEAITGRLSANINRNSKAIYPLRRVEIRKTEIKAVPAHAAVAEAPVEAPADTPVEVAEPEGSAE